MKLIIAGSRSVWPPSSAISAAIQEAGWTPTLILCGCTSGADEAGAKWADHHGIPVEHHPADWDTYGRAAGPVRNRLMAECADAALVFWDGKSRGTASLLREMKALHKPVSLWRMKDASAVAGREAT